MINLIKTLEKRQLNQLQNYKSLVNLEGYLISIKYIISKRLKRKQTLLGLCIAHKQRGLATSLTIRSYIYGFQVDYTILIYSPLILEINILRKKLKTKKLYSYKG